MSALILALQFLTRIPLPFQVDFTANNLKKALFFFPFVSAIIGALVGLNFSFFYKRSPEVAAISSLLLWILLNGGLHMDGLADMFDGFFSNKDSTTILAIMKDSRVGTFGALSLLLVILTKIFLLLALGKSIIAFKTNAINPLSMALVLFSARVGVLYSIAFFPSAREGGLGQMFQEGRPQRMVFLSSLAYGIILFVFFRPMAIVYIGGIASALLISFWSMKKIHGVTGDVFGAIMELGEMLCLWIYWGVLQWNLF